MVLITPRSWVQSPYGPEMQTSELGDTRTDIYRAMVGVGNGFRFYSVLWEAIKRLGTEDRYNVLCIEREVGSFVKNSL